MELEIKHLAPYLPYGLNMVNEFGDIWMMNTAIFYHNQITGIPYVKTNSKPILRPMSDLIPIEDDDVNDFVLIKLVDETSGHCDAYDEWRDAYFDNPIQERIMQCPYEVFEELVKQHYDVFGLIPARLAIDINTIKP